MMTVEVIEPYGPEVLRMFGVVPKTVDEYAFYVGWQDGATSHVSRAQPVTDDQLENYTQGWTLGAWNRIQWLRLENQQIAQ